MINELIKSDESHHLIITTITIPLFRIKGNYILFTITIIKGNYILFAITIIKGNYILFAITIIKRRVPRQSIPNRQFQQETL